MSILFTGYYGHLNTGDDAFGVVSDWGARKFWNQDNVKFFGQNLPKRFDGTNLKSGFKLRKKIKGQEILEMFPAGIENSKVVYAGGSVFHTEIKGITKNSILQNYKKVGLLELGAIGVSLGPFKRKDDFNSIKRYLEKFSFLALRDKRSYEVAKEMELKIPFVEAFDLAALLPKIYPINNVNNKKPVIGISVCNYERYTNGDLLNEKRRYQKVVVSLKLLIEQIPDLKVKIFIFNAHPKVGDIEISKKLNEDLPQKTIVEIINYNQNPFYMWNEVSSCDAVLATRLHAGIFSYFSQTPFLQIEYHKKCNDFLKAANYPQQFQIGDIEVTESEIVEKIIKLLTEPTQNLFSNTEALQDKALLNFTNFKDQFI